MDALESGQSFTVTRDGREIGELIPLRRRRRFVTRDEFAAMSRSAASIDIDAFRADQAESADHEVDDPYER
jgi:antitoxin (DNA-binding transcriptional repressor) of toxin-antitoxin stability system